MPVDKMLTQKERLRQLSQRRRVQEKEATKQAILNAAASLFSEQGYEGFSLRKVAERLGCSATNIYYYFTNKDDLLFAIIDEAFVNFRERLRAAASSTDEPLEGLRAVMRAYFLFGLQNPIYYQLMFLQRSDFLLKYRNEEYEPRIDSFRVLKDTVQRAIDMGDLRFADATTTSNTLWAMAHGIVSMAIQLPQRFDPESVQCNAEMAMDIILVGARKVQ
ncbi:TetR/AcrR family transcriptional regulator [Ktedonosporobacter rubrisoli]|uniref:TetR/AcrR family transcriptional regulator n=1 Tax=Ktedonosporobacter rubrisoli TaxID=2509675 RepID=A0A4P6JQM6_KTERU|nr:TetR/AcrR family transcriptional regulator [Ktedonosporobacter rubrisoli]QBD77452.1 TetR/AcrR family transcriptional regulator [Ktedonosporobacter rubrisoli]